MDDDDPYPRLHGAPIVIMATIALLSLLVTLGTWLLGAMEILYSFDAPNDGAMIAVRLTAVAVPLVSLTTTILAGVATFKGSRRAALAASLLFFTTVGLGTLLFFYLGGGI